LQFLNLPVCRPPPILPTLIAGSTELVGLAEPSLQIRLMQNATWPGLNLEETPEAANVVPSVKPPEIV
jgi:hypothetical protein